MKKFLMSVVGSVTLFGGLFFLTSVSAHTDCKEVEFDHETVCVSIEDAGHDRFSLLAENTDGTEGTLRCDIMLPDSTLQSIPSCDGSFTYTKGDEGRIKLWIRSNEEAPDDREDKPSSSSTRTYPQWMYNFDDAEWADSNLDDESEYDTDNFYITASPSDPEEDEEVDITVKARDGTSTDEEYRGRVNFTVERKSGSTWVDASSSYYDLARTSYTFTSSDDGEHDFNNLVTFTNDAYDYRLVVTDDDDDDIVGYKTFYLNGDGSDSEYDTDNFYLTASPTDPEEDEYVDITVKARDGTSTDDAYRGRVDFTVQRKSGSSRVSASSSYYTLSRTYYTFTSSDDGEHDFSNLVRFRNDAYDYRLVATDHSDDDIVGYKTFYLNGNGSNNEYDTDNFYLTASPTDPEEDEYVDITVKARDGTSTDEEYRGTVNFSVERKSGSTWVDASSSYYTLARTSYTFTSSDDGEHDFSNLVRFRNDAYDYRLVVTDDDDEDIVGSKTFYLNGDGSDSEGEIDNFYVTTDNASPDRNEYVDITIEARDGNYDTIENYTNKAKFSVKKKSGSSRGIASSSYYTLARTYYTFTSSDDGEKTLTNLIKFKQDGEYKLIVYDEDEITADGERIFDVNNGGSSSDIDGFTSAEINTVQSIYNARPGTIDNLKDQYSKLRNSTTWNTRSDTFYDDTKDILDDVSNKKYDDFDTWYTALISRWRYTISIR